MLEILFLAGGFLVVLLLLAFAIMVLLAPLLVWVMHGRVKRMERRLERISSELGRLMELSAKPEPVILKADAENPAEAPLK